MALTKETLMSRISRYPDILDVELVKISEYTNITYKCGHIAKGILSNLLYNGNKSTCNICNPKSNSKKNHQQFLKEIGTLNLDIEFIEEYKDAKSLIPFKYKICGHTHKARPDAFRNGSINICRICNPINKKSPEKFLEEMEILAPNLEFTESYIDSNNSIAFKYRTCGHIGATIPNNTLRRGDNIKCKICFPFKNTKKTNKQFLEEIYAITTNIKVIEKYAGAHIPILFKYLSCGHEYRSTPSNLLSKGQNIICRICSPLFTSKGERDIAELVSKYTLVDTNNRSLLDGLEIDIYLPELKIGIEYNGEYWHSETKKGKSYHLDKTTVAKGKDIRLIHIFEHEWLQKQDIVKSRLLGMLGQNYKLGARKCTIKELAFNEIKDFLNENHLQGSGSPSKYNFGLYYKDILEAVMTFSKPRFNSNYDYELIRYASLTGVNIQGGASKLLKYFTNKYQGSIISYSDKRWGDGNLYKTLGFKYSHSSEPSYFYAKNSTILSRYQCQKHKLSTLFPEFYKDELTELDIMSNAGFNRVYDCGTDVWILKG